MIASILKKEPAMKFFICVSLTIICLILIPAALFPLLTHKCQEPEPVDYTREFQEELIQICNIPNGEYIKNMVFSFSFPSDAIFEANFTAQSFTNEDLYQLISALTKKIDEVFTQQLMNEHETRLAMVYVRIYLYLDEKTYMLIYRNTDYKDPFNLEGVEWEIKKIDNDTPPQ